MSVTNRSAGHGIYIYNTNSLATVLRGLILYNRVSDSNFYSLVDQRSSLFLNTLYKMKAAPRSRGTITRFTRETAVL